MSKKLSDSTKTSSTFPAAGKKKRSMRLGRKWLLIIVAITIIAIGSVLTFIYITPKPSDRQTFEQQQETATLKSFEDNARVYAEGSLPWANLYGNAALYAASHDRCDRAREIIEKIKNAKISDDRGLTQSYDNEVRRLCG